MSPSTAAAFAFTSSEPVSSFECLARCGRLHVVHAHEAKASLKATTFFVRAIDNAGNVDQTLSSVVWTVDTVAPETTIASGPPPVGDNPTAAFTFSSNEPGTTFEYSSISPPPGRVARHRRTRASATACTSSPCRRRDAAGSIDGTPACHSWTIDHSLPRRRSGAAGSERQRARPLDFHLQQAGSHLRVQCRLGPPSHAVHVAELYSLADGTHSFQARARDAAGDVDASLATRTWRIDTIEPDTTIVTKPRGPINSADAAFEFTSSDAGVTFECSLESGSFAPCASPKPTRAWRKAGTPLRWGPGR